MTVCIAAIFHWNYSANTSAYAPAAIVMSDRMITAGDVQYEPQQKKIAFLTDRVVLLIAGDYSTHSQAIQRTLKNLQGDNKHTPEDIAHIYARAIRSIKLQQAESLILAPLNLNTDTFHAQQRDFSADFVDRLTHQLQNFRGEEVEALIVGGDGAAIHLYSIDSQGVVACFDDVGFAAIGIGAWHAKSQLMQVGYVNALFYPTALAAVYAAKKAAEIAPGVGTATDVHLIFRDKIETLVPPTFQRLEEIYQEYRIQRRELEQRSVLKLSEHLATFGARSDNGKGELPTPENTESGLGADVPPTEIA